MAESVIHDARKAFCLRLYCVNAIDKSVSASGYPGFENAIGHPQPSGYVLVEMIARIAYI
jgi:hypothetical protein